MRKKVLKEIRMMLAATLSVLMIVGSWFSAMAGDWQSTIIMLDNEKRAYSIGETITFTIGIADPGGGYLTSADSGFGYSQDTLKLISETDTPDHVQLGGGPAKWLYRDITFEVINTGTVYFVAGAYSGNGVIKAVRADGTVVSCPRASVVYGAGAGKVESHDKKEPLIGSVSISFRDTGETVVLEREVDPYITEYSAVLNADDAGREIDIDAVPAEKNHTAGVSVNGPLSVGENEVTVTVTNGAGTTKDYRIVLTVPEPAAEIRDIAIIKGEEKEEIGFDTEKKEYEISVPTDQEELEFVVDAGNGAKVSIPEKSLEYGTNVKYVTADVGNELVRYTFYVYREPPELSLSQLVVELSDDTTLSLNEEFSPDKTDYEGSVTSDVRKAIVHTGTSHPGVDLIVKNGDGETLKLQKDGAYIMPLSNGDNQCAFTVTDGYNTRNYSLKIHRAHAEQVTPPAETEPPRNDLEFAHPKIRNNTVFIVGAVAALVLLIGGGAFMALRHAKMYAESDEGKAEESERQRTERLKEKNKEREMQLKEKEKEKLYR